VAKSEPVIASYASWMAQHRVPTPLLCELQRWSWSTVPRNTPPQLGAAAPTLRSLMLRLNFKRYVAHHLWVPETDPQGAFYRYSRAFHRPTCAENIPLWSWRTRHSWTLTTTFIPLSIVHSPSAHSACNHNVPSAAMLRRWWTPASISWSHRERHGKVPEHRPSL